MVIAEELSALLSQPLNPHREENSVRCPLHDDRHASMSINFRKGVWNCLGCGKGGTIETLFQFLGSDLDKGDRALLKANTDPDPEPIDFREHFNVFAPVEVTTPEFQAYIREKGLTFEIKDAFHIRHDNRGNLVMPYFDGDRVVALRYRARNGFKWYESGSERTLYNLNVVRGQDQVVLAEGESDTHALWGHLRGKGIAVGGVPGANSSVAQWEIWSLELMWATKVWIAFDADDAGTKGVERAVQVLGDKARVLQPSMANDWSDALASGERPVLV